LNDFIPHSKPSLDIEERDAVQRVVSSGYLGCGPETGALESELTRYLGRSTAVLSSGTAALHLALQSLNIQTGDRIAIPTHTCPSVYYALCYLKATPALYDSGPAGYGIDGESFERACRGSQAAIVVHTYGLPAIEPGSFPEGIPVIEDCAHALGAEVDGKPVGTFGHMAIFSFYPTKMIAGGECGAVTGPSEQIEMIRNWRSPRGADDAEIRYPYSPSDLSAAISREQLKKLDRFISRRREIAAQYGSGLKKCWCPGLKAVCRGSNTWYRYVIQTDIQRDEMIKLARESGIQLGKGVLTPLHRLLGQDAGKFPHSEHACQFTVSLPIYPDLTNQQQTHIIDRINEILRCRS
jgi:perosamine synthetase